MASSSDLRNIKGLNLMFGIVHIIYDSQGIILYSPSSTSSVTHLVTVQCSSARLRPIMLKILPIMLLSSAQKICPLCSILCS